MKFDILKPQLTCGKGRQAVQEDCIFPAVGEATIHDKLFLACDGEGGDGSGYKASSCFCQTVSDLFFQETCPDEPLTDEFLDHVLRCAQGAMSEQCPESVGTSFALLYLHRHGALAAHVGSAKVYHFRPKERLLLYRSADEDRLFAPGGEPAVPVKARITHVQYGDYFVLATRGAQECLSEQRLMDILCEPVNDSAKMVRIVKELSRSGDNHSVVLVHVSGVMNEALDEQLPDNEQQLMAAVTIDTAGAASAASAATAGGAAQAPVTDSQAEGQGGGVPRREKAAPQEQPARRQAYPADDEAPRYQHDDDDEKGGFPVVLVTALVIVALGVIAWFWMRESTDRDEEEVPAVEVKKETPKKDTINIMKSEKPKALNILDENKPKEEKPAKTEADLERERRERERRERELADSTLYQPTGEGSTTPATVPSATGSETAPVPATQPAHPAQPTTTQPTTTQPATTQPTTAQPTTTAPGTVTPRPVIPEGE